jgi:hypothetical protein
VSARTDAAASLVELVLARLSAAGGWEAESKALERALGLLGQSAESHRKQRQRDAKRPGTSHAGQPLDSGSSAASAGSSSLSDSDALAPEEKEKREARPLSRPPVTGQQVDRAGGQSTGQLRNAILAGCWDGVGGVSTSGSQRARIGEAAPLLERLARERGVDPVVLFQRACDRFKADASLKAKRMSTLPVLLSQLEQWVDDAPPAPASPGAPVPVVSPARRLLNPPTPAKEPS